eukprot:4004792-Lingulodinium_polyedra.AAC.1
MHAFQVISPAYFIAHTFWHASLHASFARPQHAGSVGFLWALASLDIGDVGRIHTLALRGLGVHDLHAQLEGRLGDGASPDELDDCMVEALAAELAEGISDPQSEWIENDAAEIDQTL